MGPMRPQGHVPWVKGALAGPGSPRAPKSYFCLSPNGSPCHHLGPGDRAQGQNFSANLARGSHPLNLNFFDHFWIPKNARMSIFGNFLKWTAPARADLAPKGPKGPQGAHGQAPKSCFGLAGLPVVPCF